MPLPICNIGSNAKSLLKIDNWIFLFGTALMVKLSDFESDTDFRIK